MTPYERLKSVCELHGTTVTKFCGEIKKSKGNLATWKKGNFSSSDLKAIHERFGVSSDYILFGTVELPDYEKHCVSLAGDEGFVKIARICSDLETEAKRELYDELYTLFEKKGINVGNALKSEEDK